MARWVGEETLEELSVQVTVQVPLREVTVEAAHLRSPGGTKPMRRSYTYVPTPEVAAFDDNMARKVHMDNVQQRERVDAAFEKAAAEQPRIEARRRDATRRAKNVQVHGCARGVPAAKRYSGGRCDCDHQYKAGGIVCGDDCVPENRSRLYKCGSGQPLAA